jgi:hypothetical protein
VVFGRVKKGTKKGTKMAEQGVGGKIGEVVQQVFLFVCKPLFMLLERRLNIYGKCLASLHIPRFVC